jgi:hypothetical protein
MSMAFARMVLVLSAVMVPLMPHGEGVLTPSRLTVPAGEKVELRGASFAPGESYSLKLVGVLQEFVLGTAVPAADSTFVLSVDVPSEAGEGIYRLEAVAPDGDVSASVELTVSTPTPSAATTSSPATGRPDDVPIVRERTGAGWAAIGLLIGLAAGLGIGLLTANKAGPSRG